MNSPLPQSIVHLMTIQLKDLMEQRQQNSCVALNSLNKKYQDALDKATKVIQNTDNELYNITEFLQAKLDAVSQA